MEVSAENQNCLLSCRVEPARERTTSCQDRRGQRIASNLSGPGGARCKMICREIAARADGGPLSEIRAAPSACRDRSGSGECQPDHAPSSGCRRSPQHTRHAISASTAFTLGNFDFYASLILRNALRVPAVKRFYRGDLGGPAAQNRFCRILWKPFIVREIKWAHELALQPIVMVAAQ